jgi:serine/threonine protein kinase
MGLNQTTGQLFAAKRVDLGNDNGAVLAENETGDGADEDGGFNYNAQQLRKLESEIHLMKDLNHPHIVRYLGTDRKYAGEGRSRRCCCLFIFMEFVPGGSIASMLAQVKAQGGAVHVARDVCERPLRHLAAIAPPALPSPPRLPLPHYCTVHAPSGPPPPPPPAPAPTPTAQLSSVDVPS